MPGKGKIFQNQEISVERGCQRKGGKISPGKKGKLGTQNSSDGGLGVHSQNSI